MNGSADLTTDAVGLDRSFSLEHLDCRCLCLLPTRLGALLVGGVRLPVEIGGVLLLLHKCELVLDPGSLERFVFTSVLKAKGVFPYLDPAAVGVGFLDIVAGNPSGSEGDKGSEP